MAVQALLFSKNAETVQSLAAILAEAGIRVEPCSDIFSAIEKATKQPFPCVISDWVDQPEAGFLVKRARESSPNRNIVAIAIVDSEYAAKNAGESQIEFVFYRPIVPDEARAVLAKARKLMIIPMGATNVNLKAALAAATPASDVPPNPEDPNLLATAAHLPESSGHHYEAPIEPEERVAEEEPVDEVATEEVFSSRGKDDRPRVRRVFVAALLALAAFCLWRDRASFVYLARTPEGGVHVLRKCVAALFYENGSDVQTVGYAGTEAQQQDAYFSRNTGRAAAQPAQVRVVDGEITIPEISHALPRASDFPLPTPQFVPVVVPPPQRVYAKVPDSLKNSQPIGPPVVGATVNPAQLMVISTPAPAVASQVSEPVDLTEEKARKLAIHVVDAVYPQEAVPQKLHGLVVLQTVVGRDGSVQDVKIVRGYFLLGRAAIAAVKQWRFKPYTFNGQPVSIRTQITLSFSYPPS